MSMDGTVDLPIYPGYALDLDSWSITDLGRQSMRGYMRLDN